MGPLQIMMGIYGSLKKKNKETYIPILLTVIGTIGIITCFRMQGNQNIPCLIFGTILGIGFILMVDNRKE